MANFKIEMDDDEFLKALDKKLDELATDIFANSQTNIVQQQIIDEGTLLKSGNINREFLRKSIVYSAPYADSTEFGRLPGTQPPSDPIAAWVLRKGIARTEKEAKRIAFAIAQDIKRKGTLPRPFLGPAVETEISKLRSK